MNFDSLLAKACEAVELGKPPGPLLARKETWVGLKQSMEEWGASSCDVYPNKDSSIAAVVVAINHDMRKRLVQEAMSKHKLTMKSIPTTILGCLPVEVVATASSWTETYCNQNYYYQFQVREVPED